MTKKEEGLYININYEGTKLAAKKMQGLQNCQKTRNALRDL